MGGPTAAEFGMHRWHGSEGAEAYSVQSSDRFKHRRANRGMSVNCVPFEWVAG